MVKHIYGKLNLLPRINRPHMFIKELQLYVDYLKTDINNNLAELNDKRLKYYAKFKAQLLAGIDYYRTLSGEVFADRIEGFEKFRTELDAAENTLHENFKDSPVLT